MWPARRGFGGYTNASVLIQETVWMGDIPVATLRPKVGGGANVYYVHTDHLNAPRRITRPSDNALLWRWDPSPFGDTLPNENPQSAGSFRYNLRFPGQYNDAESGLNYNYFRDGYDPSSGRYTQSDPIGLQGGTNTYAYVGRNPIGRIDPLGLLIWRMDNHYRDLVSGVYAPYPGGPRESAGPDDTGMVTVVDWKIKSHCACKKFDEFEVDYTTETYISPNLIEEGSAWGSRAEGDHIRDFLGWGRGKGRQTARQLESTLKGKEFASDNECQRETSAALSRALANGGIKTAIENSIKFWDSTGRHDWNNPKRRP